MKKCICKPCKCKKCKWIIAIAFIGLILSCFIVSKLMGYPYVVNEPVTPVVYSPQPVVRPGVSFGIGVGGGWGYPYGYYGRRGYWGGPGYWGGYWGGRGRWGHRRRW